MQSVPTLIDTGPIVAILNESGADHQKCTDAFSNLPAPLLACWPVITEAAYMLGDYSQVAAKLYELIRTDALSILSLTVADLDPIESILQKYADQGFQLADAALMYLAEREGVEQVFTLDRRDFGVFRTARGDALTLIPEA